MTDWILTVSGGVLVAFMINYNSLLASRTSPVYASWAAHGLGALAAFALAAAFTGGLRSGAPWRKAPLWSYLGGVPGAFTVILASITVNSRLSLSGTIALILVGQVVYGMLSDRFGLFGAPRRRVLAADFLVMGTILAGSALVIFGRAA